MSVVSETGEIFELFSLWQSRRALVVFTRHMGCRFCKDQVALLEQELLKLKLREADTSCIIITIGKYEDIPKFRQEVSFSGEIYVDSNMDKPECFDILNLKRGEDVLFEKGSKRVVRGETVAAAARVSFSDGGYGTAENPYTGDILQVGGVFLLGPGNGSDFSFRSAFVGDIPDMDAVCEAVSGQSSGGQEVAYPSTQRWNERLLVTTKHQGAGEKEPHLLGLTATATSALESGAAASKKAPEKAMFMQTFVVGLVVALLAATALCRDRAVCKTVACRVMAVAVLATLVVVMIWANSSGFLALFQHLRVAAPSPSPGVQHGASSNSRSFNSSSSSSSSNNNNNISSSATASTAIDDDCTDGGAAIAGGSSIDAMVAAIELLTMSQLDRLVLDSGLQSCECSFIKSINMTTLESQSKSRTRSCSNGSSAINSSSTSSSSTSSSFVHGERESGVSLGEGEAVRQSSGDVTKTDTVALTLTANAAETATQTERLQCLEKIQCYVREFLAKPNPNLGRKGPTCPFVPSALKMDLIYLAWVPRELSGSLESVKAVVLSMLERFKLTQPTSGARQQYKTIIMVFRHISVADAPRLIDSLQKEMKPVFVEEGLMLGEFHMANNACGLHNSSFFPLRTPYPCLAIRTMVPSDIVFLNDKDVSLAGRKAMVAKFLEKFGDVASSDAQSKMAREILQTL